MPGYLSQTSMRESGIPGYLSQTSMRGSMLPKPTQLVFGDSPATEGASAHMRRRGSPLILEPSAQSGEEGTEGTETPLPATPQHETPLPETPSLFSSYLHEPEPEPEAEPAELEAAAEPEPEPEPEIQPEPEPVIQPGPEPKYASEPELDPEPEPTPAPAPSTADADSVAERPSLSRSPSRKQMVLVQDLTSIVISPRSSPRKTSPTRARVAVASPSPPTGLPASSLRCALGLDGLTVSTRCARRCPCRLAAAAAARARWLQPPLSVPVGCSGHCPCQLAAATPPA